MAMRRGGADSGARHDGEPCVSVACACRYRASAGWSLAFFTYSNERYSPCVFHNGSWYGTPEEALEIGAGYLRP
jgi:hypothetical protein